MRSPGKMGRDSSVKLLLLLAGALSATLNIFFLFRFSTSSSGSFGNNTAYLTVRERGGGEERVHNSEWRSYIGRTSKILGCVAAAKGRHRTRERWPHCSCCAVSRV